MQYAGCCLADAQHDALFPAAEYRLFPKTTDGRGGTALFEIGIGRESGSEKYSHRTESEVGGAHHEEVLMREETFSGPWREV